MTRTDRLTGIILALQGGRRTAGQLAIRFEVSRRTILRDIDALSRIGVPVVALPGAGGGFALAEGYHLPPLHFSPPEAAVLLLALGGLGGPASTPFGEARKTAEAKLRTALRPAVLAEAERELDGVAIDPPRPPDEAHLRALHDALRRERWVLVEYASLRRVASHLLFPLRLSAVDGRWYCAAVSHEAGEERSYRLDRVRAVTPVPPPPDADGTRRAAARPRRPYDDPDHPEVVVRLSYRGLRLAEGARYWAGRTTQVATDVWELRFRCPPGELAYYAREIHALGPTAAVLAPPELRSLVLERAEATAAVYAETGSTDLAAEG
jgi:predicted DNA-binding transcriptional regulator YafY